MKRFPPWLRQRIPGARSAETSRLLSACSVSTVCREAGCPNMGECFHDRRLTFLILGGICTRSCAFCGVEKGERAPFPPDHEESDKIRDAVRALGLKFVVITSVSRDDLVDGGARQFFEVVRGVKDFDSGIKVEVLIPDFKGRTDCIQQVLDARPDVLAHNVETVPRLYPQVRSQADYALSLRVLGAAKRIHQTILVKSSILAGLGESKEEIIEVMRDLRGRDVDIVTIGQYLAPSHDHYPVIEFITPGQFARYREIGLKMGFKAVQSGPLVRSSYRAHESYNEVQKCMISSLSEQAPEA